MDIFTATAIVMLSALGAALGAFVREYFRSRGKKEGEIDALRRNLDEVLRQLRATTEATERVRASISGGLWVEQEKWKLKRDAYLNLLQALSRFAEIYSEVKVLGGTPAEQARRFGDLLRERHRPDSAAESQRALLVARLVMVPEAFETLERLTHTFGGLMNSSTDDGNLDALFRAHRQAFDSLLAAARRDLELGAFEVNTGA